MIFHENRLLADDSHIKSCFIFFRKLGKILQNLSSAAVVIGALSVKACIFRVENSEDPYQMASSADLDLQCFQKRINLGSTEGGLKLVPFSCSTELSGLCLRMLSCIENGQN